MKKFKKFLLAGLCGLVLASAGGLAACDNGEPEINVIGGDYSYINPVRERAEIDEGFKIDGVLDEAEYATVKSVSMKKRLGYETADVDVTVYFGEKGLYFGFVDTENTRIYANEERSTTTGSAIEMYLMIGGTGVSEGDLYHTFEIDLTAGGRLALKRNACFANSQGNWRSCDRPDEIQPYMAVTAQGGEINTPECTGYTVEFYMPYAYFVDLGIMREAVKPEFIYMNPAHIKSNSARASDGVRTWTPLTETQLSSYNYSRPSSWYKFDENGIVTNDINVTYKGEGSGIVSEKNGFDNMPNGNSLTLNIIENADSVIKSFRVNGVECIKEIVSDGTKGIYTLSKVNGAINIEAEFEKLSDVTYQLSGVVSYTGEAAEWDDVAYNVALYANRSIKDTEIDFDKITGEYALDLAEGEYRIVLRTITGEFIKSYDISLYEDTELNIEITDDNYGPNRIVKIDSAYSAGSLTTIYEGLIDNSDFVMKFYFGTEFGSNGPASIPKYVEELHLISDGGTQKMQLLRWDSAYLVKLDQSGSNFNFDANLKATYIAQQGLYFVLVREGGMLYLYVDDGNGNLDMLAGYHTPLGDNITSVKMQGYEGVYGSSRIYFEDAIVKLGTTEYRYFNDKVEPKISYNKAAVTLEGLNEGYYSLGEAMNLTIKPNDGYMIYSMYYNGRNIEINEDGEYSFICGVGAILQINSTPIGPVNISVNEPENGVIVFDKDVEEYSLGDDIVFYLEGEAGYKVSKLFINGQDLTSSFTRIETTEDNLIRYYYNYAKCIESEVSIQASFEEAVSFIKFEDAIITAQDSGSGVTNEISLLDDNVMWIGTLSFDPTMDLSVSAQWHISVRLFASNDQFIEIQLLRWDAFLGLKMMLNAKQDGAGSGAISGKVYQALLRDQGLKILAHYNGTGIDVYACDVDGTAVKIINNYQLPSFEKYPIVKVAYYKAAKDFAGKEAYITDSSIYGMTGLIINVSVNEPEHGEIVYTEKNYKLGESIVFEILPEDGYILDTLTYNGKVVEVDDNNKFKIPCIDTHKIVIEATFIETPRANVTYTLDMDIEDGKVFTFTDNYTYESRDVTLEDGKLVLDDIDFGNYTVSFVLNGVDVSMAVKINADGEQVLTVSNVAKVPENFKNAESYNLNTGFFKVEDLTNTVDYSYNTSISGEFWVSTKLVLDAEDFEAAMADAYKNVRFGIRMMLTGNVDCGVVVSVEDKAFNLLSMRTTEKFALSGNPAYANALTGDGLYLVINRKANSSAVAYICIDGKELIEVATFNNIGSANIASIGACFWYIQKGEMAFSYSASVNGFTVAKTLAEVLGGNVIIPTSETEDKGEVIFDKAEYNIGDDVNIIVTCTADKTSIVGVSINGVDYTERFEKGETWTLKLNHSLLTELNVVVSYETQRAITATITVGDHSGDFNGNDFYFTAGDKTWSATLAEGVMTIDEVDVGTVLDAYVEISDQLIPLGQYTVSGEAAKELSLEGLFVKGNEVLDYTDAQFNVNNGSFVMNSGSATSKTENFAYNTYIEGDVYVAVKFASSTAVNSDYAWLDDFGKAIQVGVYMTVEGSSADVGLSIYLRKNSQDEAKVVQNSNVATVVYTEDGLDFSDNLENGYYLVIKREAETGNIYSWIGTDATNMHECEVITGGATGAVTGLGVCFYSETAGGLNVSATEFKMGSSL